MADASAVGVCVCFWALHPAPSLCVFVFRRGALFQRLLPCTVCGMCDASTVTALSGLMASACQLLPCPCLASHNSPVSIADLGWAYVCAHHSLMVWLLLICSIFHSFIYSLSKYLLGPCPRCSRHLDDMTKKALFSHCFSKSCLSGCVPDPLFHTSHLSQCSQHGVPLREC